MEKKFSHQKLNVKEINKKEKLFKVFKEKTIYFYLFDESKHEIFLNILADHNGLINRLCLTNSRFTIPNRWEIKGNRGN